MKGKISKDNLKVCSMLKAHTCKHFGINSEEFFRKERTRFYSYIRFCFYKVAKERFRIPYNQIASFVDKDHATIINGVETITDIIFTDKDTAKMYSEYYDSIPSVFGKKTDAELYLKYSALASKCLEKANYFFERSTLKMKMK